MHPVPFPFSGPVSREAEDAEVNDEEESNS